LYPSIELEWGIKQLEEFVRGIAGKKGWDELFIARFIDLAKFMLSNSHIVFNQKVYKAVRGTPTGNCFSVIYANICVGRLEEKILQTLKGCLIYYRRFIDDGLLVMKPGVGQVQVKEIESEFNLQSNLKFAFKFSDRNAIFLDLEIYKGPRYWESKKRLDTCCFQKMINTYEYITPVSHHPQHQIAGFIKGEFIRYATLCSQESEYEKVADLFTRRLLARNYSYDKVVKIKRSIRYQEFRKERLMNKKVERAGVVQVDKIIVPFRLRFSSSLLSDAVKGVIKKAREQLREFGKIFEKVWIVINDTKTRDLYSLLRAESKAMRV
jgi:hypothetical protein